MELKDINRAQCLILSKLGREQATVGGLKSRGYYLGSKANYNLGMMVKNRYLLQEPNLHDRRTSYVMLSEKGLKLYDKLDKLFTMHAKALTNEGIDSAQLEELDSIFISIEGFWKRLLIHRE